MTEQAARTWLTSRSATEVLDHNARCQSLSESYRRSSHRPATGTDRTTLYMEPGRTPARSKYNSPLTSHTRRRTFFEEAVLNVFRQQTIITAWKPRRRKTES